MTKNRLVALLVAVMLLVAAVSPVFADMPMRSNHAPATGCATIKSGTILDSAGNVVVAGYDQFGYNYQAHMFNGTYDSSDRTLDGTYWGSTGDFVDDELMMKWSDDWLANVDCNGDHKLDRGLVGTTVGGTSLGWLTNHVNGDYTDVDGNTQHFTDFVKIVYVGPGGPLWGAYEIIQEVYNDPAAGQHGVLTLTDPGLGQHVTR